MGWQCEFLVMLSII